jgi:3-polyprenyl-4-hydroxybenzoate decarboxylase
MGNVSQYRIQVKGLLKLSYRFHSGRKVNLIQRQKEEIKAVPKKGF